MGRAYAFPAQTGRAQRCFPPLHGEGGWRAATVGWGSTGQGCRALPPPPKRGRGTARRRAGGGGGEPQAQRPVASAAATLPPLRGGGGGPPAAERVVEGALPPHGTRQPER